MLIAVPSESPGGLEATISDHFGHCHTFTLVRVEDGALGEVTLLPNEGHAHGGCMQPVMLLKNAGVDALVAGGMGGRPLAGFQQEGITVFYREEARLVREAVQSVMEGESREFGPAQTCGGGGGGCGGHDHGHGNGNGEQVTREAIEGKADVRADRVVTLHYKLSEKGGEVLESSEDDEPMRYLHGHDNVVPGLEQALNGLEAGASKVVEVSAADAYGVRDEDKVVEVPRAELPDEIEVGAVVQAEDDQGNGVLLSIVSLEGETVRLDANHPLAGKDLVFDVTVVCVESATATEIAHGHVH